MAKRTEPAEKLLTMTPEEWFTLEKDGFFGCLYTPEKDAYPGKAVIMVGGSDGYFSLTQLIAEQFVKRGLTVMAMAYWNRPGLPDHLESVPLEYMERAAAFLKTRFEKVGVYGVSKGAEYALVCGSRFADLSCVVANMPTNFVNQGLTARKSVAKGSSWSYRGQDLPFGTLDYNKGRVLRDSLRVKGICMRSCYERAAENAPEEAVIPVEKIRGPVLLLSGTHDMMWPSMEAGNAITRRLDAKAFPYDYLHLNYERASHFLLPYPLKSAKKLFAIERKYPQDCRRSSLDAFEKTLDFLRSW